MPTLTYQLQRLGKHKIAFCPIRKVRESNSSLELVRARDCCARTMLLRCFSARGEAMIFRAIAVAVFLTVTRPPTLSASKIVLHQRFLAHCPSLEKMTQP
jgi:hypothetical protein